MSRSPRIGLIAGLSREMPRSRPSAFAARCSRSGKYTVELVMVPYQLSAPTTFQPAPWAFAAVEAARPWMLELL